MFVIRDAIAIRETPPPIEGVEYDFWGLHKAIASRNYSLSERSLRRIIRDLDIQKNDRGYYENPDLVLILGWLMNRHLFYSRKQYFTQAGLDLLRKAQVMKSVLDREGFRCE